MNSKFVLRTGSFNLAPLAAAIALSASGMASAATLTVNTGSPANAHGVCSLLEAVNSINRGSASLHCTNSGEAFGNNDSIGFSKGFAINFAKPTHGTSSALVLSKPVTINGGGTRQQLQVTIARSAQATTDFRLIESSANLVLNNVLIAGGSVVGDGGGIKLSGDASFRANNSALNGNAASGRGGGIFADSSAVTLTDSSVSGNVAAVAGGGIYTYAGEATITNATVSDNDGGQLGGGLAVGALQSNSSTISGNSAVNGGGAYTIMPSHLVNTTVSGNAATVIGGGIYASGNISLEFTTIANNSVAANGTGAGLVLLFDGNSAVASMITGNGSGQDIDGPYSAMLSGNHNLVGSIGANVHLPPDTLRCDPNLGALMDNGGPTLTMAPASLSCAIDAGPSTTSVVDDQRGALRVVGLHADIGAVENQN